MYRPSNTTVESVLSQVSDSLNGTPAAPAPAPAPAPEAVIAEPIPNPLQEELDSTRKQLAKSKAEHKASIIDNALIDSASRAGLLDPTMARDLLGKNCRVSESGQIQIIADTTGVPRLGQDFSPLTLDGLMEEFCLQRPWAVRSSLKGGAGSTPASRTYQPSEYPNMADIFGRSSSSRKAADLMRKDPASYRRMKIAAKEAGLID
jgi:hypothetical protein